MTDLVSRSKALLPPMPTNTSSRDTSNNSDYTNLHLSALAFLHPPNPPHIVQCPCEAQTAQEQKEDSNKHIRVYFNEPSGYAYNPDCYLIKESRYSTLSGWHSPGDDLVADDAGIGSAVVAVGKWQDVENSGEEVWKTSVYYTDKNGKLRERTNHSFFAPIIREEFESELPKPEKLVPPTPGWKPTPLHEPKSKLKADADSFPSVLPLPTTKLTAAYSDDGSIHVFYQAKDDSIRELSFHPDKGWLSGQEEQDDGAGNIVVGPGKVKSGTPLAVVTGSWMEFRLFCVDKANVLREFYSDDHTDWIASKIPSYTIQPTAMLAAVAWNYASPYYQIRLYSTTNNDDLLEFSFSRKSGGWAPSYRSVSAAVQETLPGSEAPLSAVAAIVVENEWKTKVYYHPRRKVIAEWDVCAKGPTHAGITNVSARAIEKRKIEEETRMKIRKEEERKRQEEKRRLDEKKRQEERRRLEEKRRQEELQKQLNVSQGETIEIKDEKKAAKLKEHSGCTQGFAWQKEPGGWRCKAGGHFITDEDFAAL